MTKSSNAKLPRRLYRFLLLLALCYALVTPLWWLISPWYSRALAWSGNLFLGVAADAVEYRYDDGQIMCTMEFSATDPDRGQRLQLRATPHWDGRLLHFSFSIWLALILATPVGDTRRKLKLFLIGWAILFAGQLAALFFQTLQAKARTLQQLAELEGYGLPGLQQFLLAWGGRFFMRIGNKLLPIVIWLIVGLPFLLKPPRNK